MPDYELAAERAAKRYRLDPKVFKAMIRQESGFKENVGSSAGARDIAQFMPATAKQYGVTLGDNRVSDDLDGAARYLSENLKKYGSYEKALSVYNSGRPDAYKDPGFAGGQTYNYVKTILGGAKSEKVSSGGTPKRSQQSSAPAYQSVTTATPGVDNSQQRKLAVASFLGQGGVKNASAVTQLAGTYGQLADVPGTTSTKRVSGAVSPSTRGRDTGNPRVDSTVEQLKREMQTINDAKVPYLWGGGHGGKHARGSKVAPLDCSGAVSRALGIDPRVSGQFKQWGDTGKGNRVTVYANDEHVLMEVDGHFWGTSASNPGGGAGWIPKAKIPDSYLKNFTARHPPGA